MNGCAPGLALMERLKATRKWAIMRICVVGAQRVKQGQRRATPRTRPSQNEFIFYKQNWRLSRSVQCAYGSKNVLRLNIQWRRSISNGNTKN